MSSQTPRYPAPPHSGTISNPSFSQVPQGCNNPQQLNSKAHGNNYQTMDFNAMPPTTPPRTPRRTQQGPPNSARISAVQDSASKPKSNRRNRPKNVNTSPSAKLSERTTPPLTGHSSNMPRSTRPISTPSAAAFAGPTFHASPAPSALPLPSFYSKSVPESPGMQALQKPCKEQTASSSSNSPTSSIAKAQVPLPAREESPLDFIFNAHREESRARSASGSGGPFEPPASSPQNKIITPVSNNLGPTRGHFSGGSASSLFAMELDGNNSPGKPIGAAFSTPYTERINAARSSSFESPQQSADRSQALKEFLFSQQSPQQQSSLNGFTFPDVRKPLTSQRTTSTPLRGAQNSYPRQYEPASTAVPRTGNRSSGLRQEVPFVTPTKILSESPYYPDTHSDQSSASFRAMRGIPSQPQCYENMSMSNVMSQGPPPAIPFITSSGTSSDLRGMEDNLRRLLKLGDPEASSTSNAVSGVGNLPAASTSVPNYVGGRAPPMNGLHNGVMGS